MADNPIKYSDFIQPDESVAKLISQLEALQITYAKTLEEVKKGAVSLENAIKKVNNTTEEGREETRKASSEADKLASAEERLRRSREETGKQLAKVKASQAQQNQINKLTVKLNEEAEGSYNKLSAQYSLNKIELNAMSKAQRQNTQAGQELEKQTADIYKEMKRLQEATGKHTLNVGNYKNSVLDAMREQVRLNQQLQKTRKDFQSQPKIIRENEQAIKSYEKEIESLEGSIVDLSDVTGKSLSDIQDDTEGLDFGGVTDGADSLADSLAGIPGPAQAAAGGFAVVNTAAKALLVNPIIGLIAAVAAGLMALFNLFRSTKSGADLLAKGSAALSGVFSFLVGVTDKLFKGLMILFENPKKAMEGFWEALKKNIVNRFTALLDLSEALNKAIKSLFKLDFEGLENAAADAGTALIQMNTGLDKQQQLEYVKSIQDTTVAIYEQVKAFMALEEARRATRRTNRELEKQLETIITQEELLKAIADDSTKSFKETEDAAKQAAQLTIKRAKIQERIAKSNLDLINRELDLRVKNGEDVEDLLDQQLTAYKTLKEAQRNYLLSSTENQKRESQLKQDRLEIDLDILIDGFDNQKAINERLIKDESKTFEERKKLLEQTRGLFEASFAKQIETIQKFTGIQVDANALIAESDAVALNKKIRGLGLSKTIEGRLLEVVRDRKTGMQDLAEAEKELVKNKEKADKKALSDQIKLRKKQYGDARNKLSEEYELRLSEIDIMKGTEAEKTRLRLQAEKDRLEAVIKLNEKGLGDLSKLQIDTLKNTVKKIDEEMEASAKEGRDIYSMVGLKLDDEAKTAINDSVQFAVGQVQSFMQAKVDASAKAVEASNTETQAAQASLDAEIEARNEGYASNVASARKELALAKKTQQKALRDQEQAQKAQEQIETLQQVGSLVTAAAKIWASLSFPWAIPAIAVMFGSFAFAKVKASQAAKSKQYGDGGLEILGGGSHASGNDTLIGHNNGYQIRGERDEALAIINKSKTRKYRKDLPKIIDSLNKGVFEEKYGKAFDLGGVAVNSVSEKVDLTALEGDVKDIRKQGERRYYVDGKGRTIETYKNLRRVHNAN